MTSTAGTPAHAYRLATASWRLTADGSKPSVRYACPQDGQDQSGGRAAVLVTAGPATAGLTADSGPLAPQAQVTVMGSARIARYSTPAETRSSRAARPP